MDFRAATEPRYTAANSGKVILAAIFFTREIALSSTTASSSRPYTCTYRKIKVAEGHAVQMHQLLGLSGATGRATGPHLHFAARWQGGYLDPGCLFKLKLPPTP